MIRFLIHYFTSNTRHGTHSPFVYALADEVIYNRNYKKNLAKHLDFRHFSGRYNTTLHAILSYLKIDVVVFDRYSDDDNSNVAILKNAIDVKENDISNIQENDVLVVFDLYKNSKSRQNWNRLKSNPKVHVTIDLYYFGLVLHRPQQRKENFKLKYPF